LKSDSIFSRGKSTVYVTYISMCLNRLCTYIRFINKNNAMKNTLLLIISILLFACCSCNTKEKNSAPAGNNQVVMCAPKTTDANWYKTDNKAPVFEGLSVLTYPITTKSPEAQQFFNQGLVLSYAFNHAEAARSFYYATKLDSTCAMCYWGFAYVLGPNYNAGMETDNYERAYSAVQKALKFSTGATPKEKDLINALSKRYSSTPPEDRSPLDAAYAGAMKDLAAKYPDDPEINCLYVESIMDMHPWDLWDKEGNPKAWTPEIISILEKVKNKWPR
jgi:hypothetical protein